MRDQLRELFKLKAELEGSGGSDSACLDSEIVLQVEEAFTTQYKDPHDVLKHFKDYLSWCHWERKNQTFLEVAPFIPIVQSSGYGKTRMIAELAREIHVLYICNRAPDSTGFPLASPKVEYIFRLLSLPSDGNSFSQIQPFAMMMIVAVQEIKARGLSPDVFWNMQIYERSVCTEFWEKIIARYKGYKDMESELKPILSDEEYLIKLFEKPHNDHEITLLCCFDEAHMLIDESKNLESRDRNRMFRLWRRAIRSIKWSGFFSVCLSTNGKIGNFFPMIENDISARQVRFTQFQPFIDVATTDVLVPDTFPECPTPLQLVKLGRPLFGVLVKDENYILDVVRLASAKLDRTNGQTKEGALARLACLAAVKISPRAALAEEMVADHMATALGISPDRSKVYITYASEPVLAAAALSIYPDERRWSKDVHWLAESLSQGIADSGECGEVAARIALLRAMQKVCQAKNKSSVKIYFCEPVTVQEFLSSLVLEDGELTCKMRSASPNSHRPSFFNKVSEKIRNLIKTDKMEQTYETPRGEAEFMLGQVAFNHFLSVYCNAEEECPSLSGQNPDETLLKACWQRRAAITMKHGYKAIDLAIPVRLGNGKFSCIAVQVKNRQEETSTEVGANIWAMELQVRRWFREPPPAHLNLYISLRNPRVSVGGSFPLSPLQTQPGTPSYIIISNCGSFAFTEKLVEGLKLIINSRPLDIPANIRKLTYYDKEGASRALETPMDRSKYIGYFLNMKR
ncbi:uncharacterized protein VTP21DRAFT_3317 [Calcarisporiella thermophila]|uniref:uncharacterized protein n=1 Tax=Calcarisporiella thermophila TaxID=911321 RepID=UPI00374234EE